MEKKKKQDNGRKGTKHTEVTKAKISVSMQGNINAEHYTLDNALQLFSDAIIIAKNEKYDFIGEVATHQDIYIDVYIYLTKKYKELAKAHLMLKRICESNCFSNAKKGKIVASLAIMNLKSNHNWTDRVANNTDITSAGEKLQLTNLITFSSDVNDEDE